MTVETRPIPAVEPKVKTVPDVLRHAALYIEEHGWAQGTIEARNGTVCAWGALAAVCRGPKGIVDPESRFFGASDVLDGVTGGNVVAWNDTPGRTAAEVTAALRAAADAAEAQ